MLSLFSFLAPVALILPQPADDDARTDRMNQAAGISVAPLTVPPEGEQPQTTQVGWLEWLRLERASDQPISRQVRIERRIVIRISPSRGQVRRNLTAQFAPTQGDRATKIEERKVGKCIPMRGIAGVQADEGNRLLFYMHDQRVISARLKKSCRSEAFYAGFYIEPAEDGQLCVERDLLQSRSGEKCEVDRLRHLVPVRN